MDKWDFIGAVIVVFLVGVIIGSVLTSTYGFHRREVDCLQDSFDSLQTEMATYKDSDFSIRLQGRRLEIWDGLGLIDSVSFGD